LKEFIAYAKANPGKVTLGHAGVGSSNYLICQTFVKAAGIEVTLVGYRGAGPALNDLAGGQIDGVCDTATSLSGAILGKQVNGIVSGSAVRLPSLPDVPTAAEAGLPEFESQGWNALFVPKGTSDAVIAKLNESARKALATEAVIKRFSDLSSVLPSADEQTQPFIAKLVPDEIEKFRKLLAK
jgi:tripartite-type tricarboxylate transporter receptor subunit TctC